jgi:3-hydroxybutyryl-CoA dehydrogenase
MAKTKKKVRTTRVQAKARAKVYICGESPMAEAYAEICRRHGYAVEVDAIEQPKAPTSSRAAHTRRPTRIAPATSLAIELTNTNVEQKRANLQRLDKALAPTAAILSSAVTVTATEQSSWITYRNRLVGIGALPTLIDRPLVEVAPTVFSPKETLEVVQRFFQSIGKEIAIVQDRVGLVLPRILCQIVNEASFALQEEIAAPQDLDTAMKLGTNYPLGPVEWADKIGLKHVVAVLSALERDLQEDRYRSSPLLKQIAQSGVWWNQV